VHLCSTFAANPFIMAFARRFAASPGATPETLNSDPGEPRSAPAAAAAGAGADAQGAQMRAFCRGALRECIGQVSGSIPFSLFFFLHPRSLGHGEPSSVEGYLGDQIHCSIDNP
jgi:hypothetical protein